MLKIVKWILNNKEWLFSGAGLLFLSIFIPGIRYIVDTTKSSLPINEEETLYFGYLPDAWPVSYNEGNSFSGYCADLMDDMNSNLDITFKEAIIQYPNRFKRYGKTWEGYEVPSKNLIVECGPNTITKKRIEDLKANNGKFSEAFYWTGAKLLVKNVDDIITSLLDDKMPLRGEKISILGCKTTPGCTITTTESLIKKIYTRSEIKPILDNRGQVLEHIAAKYISDPKKNVAIYASDEILLEGLLRKHWNKLIAKGETYCDSFFPEWQLSYEEYGIVVYDINKNFEMYQYINQRIKEQDLGQWLKEDPDWLAEGKTIGRENNTEARPQELSSCWKKDN